MKYFAIISLFVLTATAAFSQTTAITIRSDVPCQVYLVENSIDVAASVKDPAGLFKYQPPGSLTINGVKTVEQERALGTTPVTVEVEPGPHEFRIDTGGLVATLDVNASGKPQTWRVNVPSPILSPAIGWGFLGGLTGVILLAGPSYIESERNQNGIGRIGFAVSGSTLLLALLATTINHVGTVREQ